MTMSKRAHPILQLNPSTSAIATQSKLWQTKPIPWIPNSNKHICPTLYHWEILNQMIIYSSWGHPSIRVGLIEELSEVYPATTFEPLVRTHSQLASWGTWDKDTNPTKGWHRPDKEFNEWVTRQMEIEVAKAENPWSHPLALSHLITRSCLLFCASGIKAAMYSNCLKECLA